MRRDSPWIRDDLKSATRSTRITAITSREPWSRSSPTRRASGVTRSRCTVTAPSRSSAPAAWSLTAMGRNDFLEGSRRYLVASPTAERRRREQILLLMPRGAPVVRRRIDVAAEFGRGVPAPAWVVEHAARQRYHVGLPRCDDLFGLFRLGDEADGDGVDAGCLFQGLRERHLIAGAERNFLQGRHAARGGVDPVDAALFQLFGKFDGLREVPAALDPVGRRNLDADRLRVRKRRADRVEYFQRIAHAVLQAPAISVGAPVGDRRQELVQEITVRAMQLEAVEAEPLGAFRRRDKRVAHAGKTRRIERPWRRLAPLVRHRGGYFRL